MQNVLKVLPISIVDHPVHSLRDFCKAEHLKVIEFSIFLWKTSFYLRHIHE